MHELRKLKRRVCEQKLRLVKEGLCILTEGNVSQLTSDRKYMIITPSGVSGEELRPEQMVVVSLNGQIYEGASRPSSDTMTHLAVYRARSEVFGIAHSHALHASTFAQAKLPIPCLGTTHADSFNGDIPVTRDLTEEELAENYEANLGLSVVEIYNPEVPAVLIAGHGPFTFGASVEQAVDHMCILEQVALMASRHVEWRGHNVALRQEPQTAVNGALFRKHYERKHGPGRYYGQA